MLINRTDSLGYCYYTANGIWAHDAWESLGGYQKKPDPKAVDLTDKLDKAMKTHAKELSDYLKKHSFVETGLYFAEKSKPGGDWDLKSQDDWNLNPSEQYRYKNTILRYDDVGNIHYGYVGREAFSKELLLTMGGVVQISTKTSSWKYRSSRFDDPRDQSMITYGVILWERSVVQ